MLLTATARIELAMPPSLAWTVVRQIVAASQLTAEGHARANRVLGLLRNAATEPLADLRDTDRRRMSARMDRTMRKLLADLEALDCTLVQALHALHEALRILIETGAVAVIAGGSFDLGWLALKDWIFDPSQDDGQGALNERVFDSAEASGRKLGHELLAIFQRHGLYVRAIGHLTFAGHRPAVAARELRA